VKIDIYSRIINIHIINVTVSTKTNGMLYIHLRQDLPIDGFIRFTTKVSCLFLPRALHASPTYTLNDIAQMISSK